MHCLSNRFLNTDYRVYILSVVRSVDVINQEVLSLKEKIATAKDEILAVEKVNAM
jgi:hypothetical protein